MCDTVVALPAATAARVMLFGKNSDRQRNEAQALTAVAAADHEAGATVTCSYLTIPQVRRTHALMLSCPFWAWGAEMGANEHGVTIGNEAVHARSAPSEEKELPGLDLVRLGLERATTAAEAVSVMTSLLEKYGQGGNCGHLTPAYYNNGFIIADPSEAFVLETVNREWMVERVQAVRAISNVYSIGRSAERVSAGLLQLIRTSGWSDDPLPEYAEVMANPHREHIGRARGRRARATALLSESSGRLDVSEMIRILRDHGDVGAPGDDWQPESSTYTICMHAGGAGRVGQTAGSWVSELREREAVHWVTGTAAPCTSIFKPLFADTPPPLREPRLADHFDPSNLWWLHERLHRSVLVRDFGAFLQSIRVERDALEERFRARIAAVRNGGSHAERARAVAECWKEAADMEERWAASIPPARTPGTEYHASWDEANRIAGIDLIASEVE